MLLQVIEEAPYQDHEIQRIGEAIGEAIVRALDKKTLKKMKRGEAPLKKVIELITTDLQALINILKIFGKEELISCLQSGKKATILFEEKFQTLFNVEEIEDFAERYQNTFGSFRDNTALFTYLHSVKKLPLDQREAVEAALTEYVNAVLTKNFPNIRYDVEKNPHLKKLFENVGDLKQTWLSKEEPKKVVKTEDSTPLQVQYEGFFLQKIFKDKHLNSDHFPYLCDYLQGKKAELANPETPQEKFQAFAIDLCEGKQTIEEFVEKVKGLNLQLGEFKNDLNSLTSQKSYGKYEISESDDPCDLLMIGTEIQGSCQRVGGDPDLNKCLVSYLMNGEILRGF